MSETKDNRFASGVNAIMAVVFILNLIYLHEDNIIMIALTGGGRLVDILSATNASVFSGFQVHRLITYGYLQPAIWHLLANVYALWYVGLYLEKALGLTRLFVIYHVGLIVRDVEAAGSNPVTPIFIAVFYLFSTHFRLFPRVMRKMIMLA